VQRIWVAGLAQDVCIKASVLDARRTGFEVRVIRDGTYPIEQEEGDGRKALDAMTRAGAFIEAEAS
jgi:nicotinamidase/pyrazinamidase